MQFRRQPELHSDGIKVGLFGEEGRDEPFVPADGYTMANDELKNISVACGCHAATENPAVENSGFLSRLPLLHWIEAKLDRACVLNEPERVRLIEI